MNIQSELYKNRKANFSGTDVEFNENGVAKVSKELGEKIISNFPEKIWEEGNKPVKDQPKDETEVDSVEVNKLKNEIHRLNGIISSKESELKQAKESEKIWREKYSEFETKVKDEYVLKSEDVDVDEEGLVIPEGMEEIAKEMGSLNFLQLKKWVKDNFNKSEEDLKELPTKDSLMKFVFSNTK